MIKEQLVSTSIELIERGMVPDWATRRAINGLCAQRLKNLDSLDESNHDRFKRQFVDSMRDRPIAPVPEKANEQHYELPSEFFEQFLGPRRKYSCCYWPEGVDTLAAAEETSLWETCKRAEIKDGMSILELGCGWGSLSLWMAERFPSCQITAVSNSTPQREYILAQCRKRGINNLSIVTCDMNDFSTRQQFDRVVSVEMFEHMRNYEALLKQIRSWLYDDGKLFVHIFCHRNHTYEFETDGASNWMGRYFFTGGIMPRDDLLSWFNDDMTLTRQWQWDGTHYQKTCEAWLRNIDENRARIMPILETFYGAREASRWLRRWRLFFLAGAGLFGFENGSQWYVGHYLLEPVKRDQR